MMKSWILSTKVLALTLAIALTPSCGQKADGLPDGLGVKGPIFTVVDGKIVLTMKLLNFTAPIGGTIPVPHTQKSNFTVGPNVLDGGSMIEFSLDPDDIKGVVVADDPNTLPDGRPLPGIPGGVLPSLRADTQLLNTSFYFASTLFGVYIPFKLDTAGYALSYPISLQGQQAGLIGLVASDAGGKNSGIVLFLKLDALKKPAVQRLLKMSERNPHLVY